MSLKPGDIAEGTVEKITSYGAFISLKDGNKGLVHISEIAPFFIKDINGHLKEKQQVKVKVISINPDGHKISLSIKQVRDQKEEPAPVVWEKKSPVFGQNAGTNDRDFEEKLAKFLKSSSEKLSDLKRNIDSKRGYKKFSR